MQSKVNGAVREYRLTSDPAACYMDAVSELGEVGKALLASSRYGEEPIALTTQIVDELGDALFSLLRLCSSLGVDAEEAIEGTLCKYAGRHAQKGHIGSDR